VIESVDRDDPAPNELVVEVAAAGLCRSDLHFLDGQYEISPPAVLGHESAGVVVEVGSDVTYVAPGDHVITYFTVGCRECPYCIDGNTHNCVNRAEAGRRPSGTPPRISTGGQRVAQLLNLGSFAEQMLVLEDAVVKIPDDFPMDQASLLGCGVTTGLGAVFNTAKVLPGETVAVIGCGGVGLSVVQGARIAGASAVIAVDVIDEKLALAGHLGATHAVNGRRQDPVETVKQMTDGYGVHHSFEALGSKPTIETAFSMLRWGGQATVVGLPPDEARLDIAAIDLFDEKRLAGSKMGSTDFRRDIPRYLQWYRDGRLLLDEMVSRRLTLDEINEGFDDMRAGLSARSIIVFD
jgi:S-(hydroxymethyl)glutathione dehydrogenase/alcohol dehydrogenase